METGTKVEVRTFRREFAGVFVGNSQFVFQGKTYPNCKILLGSGEIREIHPKYVFPAKKG